MLGWPTVFWNLFLIGVALGALLYAKTALSGETFTKISVARKIIFVFWLLVFLAFFPNIAYLFTDARHILDFCSGDDRWKRCPEAPWAIFAYFSYGVIAIPFYVFSIDQTTKMFAIAFHKIAKKIVPPVMIFLSAIGVCIGLFNRLNSWDLLNPIIPIQAALSYFTDPGRLLTLTICTVCLAGIFYFFRFFFYNAHRFFEEK